MTILNAWITDEAALVGVDTEAALLKGQPMMQVSKLIPLVHLNAVLAVRGDLLYLSTLHAMCNGAGAATVDALVAVMPRLVVGAYQELVKVIRGAGVTDITALHGQSVVLVGWSARERRMIGRSWEQNDPARGFLEEPIAPHFIAPWGPELEHCADPITPALMFALGRAQQGLMRACAPGKPAGGRMVVAMVNRASISIGSVGVLGPTELKKAAA